LRQMGFVEGGNVSVEFRWADGHYERLPDLATNLANLSVNVIFAAGGSPAALAAKAVTSTIPVVFVTGDPVNQGLVASLNHPGGNVTGISNLSTDLPSKSTELLKQLRSEVKTIGYLVNPTNTSAKTSENLASLAAGSLGVELRVMKAQTKSDLDAAFDELKRLRIVLLEVMADAFFDSQREHIVALSLQNKIAGCLPMA
jgi:putative tryptophan/tyrosine transport system substrate-binding protein